MTVSLSRLPFALRDALQRIMLRVRNLARHYWARLYRVLLRRTTFIGVVGSAGKTTVKDLTAAILSAHSTCKSSPGTGNEPSAVEWAVRATHWSHRYSIVELSESRPGALDRPLRVVRPHIGVLTLIAREHYSAFGSIEAIAAETAKLVARLPRDGVAVLNRDDAQVRAIGERHSGRIVWVGREEGATVRLFDSRSQWPEPLILQVGFDGVTYDVRTQLHGIHLALPVLCALGVAVAVGVPMAMAVEALARAEPSDARMQIVAGTDGVVFVRDDWKAPEWSFAAPLHFMRVASARRKFVVIGSISDSPRSPSQRYAYAARQALEAADFVLLVGVDARGALKAEARRDHRALLAFPGIREAAEFLRNELREGDFVLLKGTNKQDHLVRLVLDRQRPVQCWIADCGRVEFCGSCERLYLPGASGDSSALAVDSAGFAAGATGLGLVVVGLGNPNPRRRGTPHNVGYDALDRLVQAESLGWAETPEGLTCSVSVDGNEITLFKPAASMNLTGSLVRRYLELTGRTVGDCVIVQDDIDLELGVARSKQDGGDSGHRGLRSVIEALGTDRISRVRVGVRRPGDDSKAAEVVLAAFSTAERQVLDSGLKKAETLIRAAGQEYATKFASKR